MSDFAIVRVYFVSFKTVQMYILEDEAGLQNLIKKSRENPNVTHVEVFRHDVTHTRTTTWETTLTQENKDAPDTSS